MGIHAWSTVLKLVLAAAPLLVLVVMIAIVVIAAFVLPSRAKYALDVFDFATKFVSVLLGRKVPKP
jgi:hypothetical protein